MCDPISASMYVGATTVAAAYQGEQQRKAQSKASADAKRMAEAQAQAAEEATNKASAKAPSVDAIAAANARLSGAGSTMLTGPGGVDPSKLLLGKSTLLGA